MIATHDDIPAPSARSGASESPAELFLRRVTHSYARTHLVLCERGKSDPDESSKNIQSKQSRTENDDPRSMSFVLSCTSQTSPAVLLNVQRCMGLRLQSEIVEPEALARRIDEVYDRNTGRAAGAVGAAGSHDDAQVFALESAGTVGEVSEEELKEIALRSDANLLSLEGKGPVVRLVDAVLFDAIGRDASDIHVQPLADETLIRLRIDGVLSTVRSVTTRLAPAIVSRIKVMGRMDVAERRAPQDGRATVTIGRGPGQRAIDLRISSLPSTFGERVVIRLLDVRSGLTHARIESLHMPDHVRRPFLDRATRSSGIVLVTGPTGSGKTTTLYATLRHIIERSFTGGRTADVNVLTIEDPVEYDLSAAAGEAGAMPISQTQVDPKKGVTFASGLRHILRQDPDVIMVGEIRDPETARIAIQASLTGHLVFSTLHTNDACGAVARLLDLGAEPFLVASSLSAVLAQRLVRMQHQECRGEGCVACLKSGYKGRRGIFELLVMDEILRELVNKRASLGMITQAAVKRGLRRLEVEGQNLVSAGLTTADEVTRVTRGVE
jgi:general secretion pathway protein E